MIITDHGILQLVVISFTLIANAVSSEQGNGTKSDNLTSVSTEEGEEIEVKSTFFRVKDAPSKSNETGPVKLKRAARYDTAASSPWVRMFNRPPGTNTESFYETRGNTSAHTSGEKWDSFRDNFSAEEKIPASRTDAKVRDILRVRTKPKDASQTAETKAKVNTEVPPAAKQPAPSTQTPVEDTKAGETGSKQNKGYVIWTSSDGKSNTGWSLDDTSSIEDKEPEPSMDTVIPKDGSQWKVVGEGGDDVWKVIDDKGDVEWKIEYDDGEWRVTSTGNVPEDAEWADPEYVWGPSDGLANDDDYNAWPADDYRLPQDFAYPDAAIENTNDSWPQQDDGFEGNEGQAKQAQSLGIKENLQYGTRRKAPTKTPSSVPSTVEDRTDSESYETDAEDPTTDVQNDQGYIGVKSWVPGQVVGGGRQKWVQGYGSKSWNADVSGLNAATGGETWVETSKNYNPWVPKIPGKQGVDQQLPSADFTEKQDNAIRAWGTGYGSKTWKGNEWDSSIVWNTAGFNGGIPWDGTNSTRDSPERSINDKKQQVWSQPIPSNVEPTGESKRGRPPQKNIQRVQIKWPGKPYKGAGRLRKPPPSRRTEGESWGDDNTFTGVIWKQDTEDDTAPATTPAPEPSTTSAESNGWQVGGWKVSPPPNGKPPAIVWKSNSPKVSNLVSVSWNTGNNPLDSPPWSQGQWVDTNIGPTWVFDGCKMAFKCGGSKPDTADDSENQKMPEMPDDSSMPTTVPQPPQVSIPKGWPPKGKGIKSWRPPPKSWRPPPPPPPQMQTTPPPTTPETTNPPMTWKPPAPPVSWIKPGPPPFWKQPSSTDSWTDSTPTLPNMSWKPPSFIRWKGPKPNKSGRPPPTKSWKPPQISSMKTWQPPIATPQPDPVTKPDCKDTTEPTETPMQPSVEDNSDDTMEPPQIIIITKLPKGAYPRPDSNGDPQKKIPFGPWVFPSRKDGPKTSTRKDKNVNIGGSMKSRPSPSPPKVSSRPPKRPPKSWYKGVPPSKYIWANSMSRWTTKKPQVFSPWKNPFYKKSKSWGQMFKRWLEGQ